MIKKKNSQEKHFINSLIKSEILKIKNNFPTSQSVLIESLKIVQKYYGWVSDSSIKFISEILNISISDIESVATFYSQIFRKPVGRYVIKICDSMVCYVLGYKKIKKIINTTLNIKFGKTTRDKNITFLPICCLGACDKGPVIMINEKTYFNVNKSSILKLLDSIK
ncbi:MAG: NADH-quinone oxidoreductase subunit NuoE [Buchnera aphidicola (Periphyllus acericola)]|uniref:NADH-quinone oxidoreductase subunit NuoE n=1 Tax=Buchnera aphidicola TaxID=9 RepID=UPI0030CD1B5F|nr:NADH-quinone oxidoreductase subunit NuoE [Buchnera aphidicola (Periphyllus acericola)]